MKTPEENRELLSELIRIMKIDGTENDHEERMIQATLEYLGVSNVEYEVMKQNPLAYNPPKNPMNRIVHFYKMAVLVVSDQEITEKEVSYLSLLGLKMGLRNEAVQAVLSRLSEKPNEMLSPQEVISIFQVFHN